MQSWNLLELEMPEGSRSPIVLHSEDEARAVLIGLNAGQALGDHQVHENAWLVVVDGQVAGTWKHTGGHIELEPFFELDPAVERELRDEADRLAAFHA